MSNNPFHNSGLPYLDSRLNSPQNWFSSITPSADIASGLSGSGQTVNDHVYRIYSHVGVISGFSFVGNIQTGSIPNVGLGSFVGEWTIIQDGTGAASPGSSSTVAWAAGTSPTLAERLQFGEGRGALVSYGSSWPQIPDDDIRAEACRNVPLGFGKFNGGCGYKAGPARLYRSPSGSPVPGSYSGGHGSSDQGYATGSFDIIITVLDPQPYIALSLADVLFDNSYAPDGPLHAVNLPNLTALEAGWRATTLNSEALAYPIEPTNGMVEGQPRGETTTGGDARKVYFAIIDWLAQSYLNIPTASRPSKLTVSKSTSVAATTGILTTNYNFQFKLVSTGLEVEDEIPATIGNAPNG
jgi:hypothetical protein